MLNQPVFTPPDLVFKIVWPILYAAIVTSVILYVRNAKRGRQFRDAMCLLTVHAALNLSWSVIFFRLHLIGWATVSAVMLALSALSLLLIFSRVSKISAVLFVPYTIWLFFAVCLSVSFWSLN
jgi:tryptophan-rich sensory protein